MSDFEIGGTKYQIAKLDARTQFHVMRRIAPLMAAIGGSENKSEAIFAAIGKLSDEDSDYVLAKCLAGCRRQNGETWAKVYVDGKLMFEEIGLSGMMALTFETLKENLGGFFTGLGSLLPQGEAA